MEKIKNILPMTFPWKTQDPFLFCAHHLDHYPEGNEEMGPKPDLLKGRNIGNDFVVKDGFRMYHGSVVPGFPSHPHRGFETVTIARRGMVDHSDSLGAAGRFGEGDVQWMTAGRGVQHSEMFPLIHTDQGNTLEIFQIWLNLPREKKFVDPHFSMIWAEDIPEVDVEDDRGKITKLRIIAGPYNEVHAPKPAPDSWASDPENGVVIWTIEMEEGAEWTLPASASGLSSTLYFFEGDTLEVEGQSAENYHAFDLVSEEEIRIKNGSKKAELLLLQGRPVNEPVFQYGPFVMNSEEGIRETMKDYGKSQFGGWPWPRPDNVHDRSRKRFARYADGQEEERDFRS